MSIKRGIFQGGRCKGRIEGIEGDKGYANRGVSDASVDNYCRGNEGDSERAAVRSNWAVRK